MDRRRFVQTAAWTAAAAGAGAAGWLIRPRSRAEALAHPALLDLLGDVDGVRSIGIAYRTLFDEERTADALERAIARSVGPAALLSDRLLQTKIDRRVQRDFDLHDTVGIGGWILSRTEARQCALFSILYA